jgi:hypothetical protein
MVAGGVFVTVGAFSLKGQATEATVTAPAQDQVAQFEFWLQIARGDRTRPPNRRRRGLSAVAAGDRAGGGLHHRTRAGGRRAPSSRHFFSGEPREHRLGNQQMTTSSLSMPVLVIRAKRGHHSPSRSPLAEIVIGQAFLLAVPILFWRSRCAGRAGRPPMGLRRHSGGRSRVIRTADDDAERQFCARKVTPRRARATRTSSLTSSSSSARKASMRWSTGPLALPPEGPRPCRFPRRRWRKTSGHYRPPGRMPARQRAH